MIQTGTRRRRWAAQTLLIGIAAATSSGLIAGTAAASEARHRTAGGPDHIFYILMENHAYDQTIGNTQDAPFINQLASQNRLVRTSTGSPIRASRTIFPRSRATSRASSTTARPARPSPAPLRSSGRTPAMARRQRFSPPSRSRRHRTPALLRGQEHRRSARGQGAELEGVHGEPPGAGSEVEYAPVINGTTVHLYAQKHNPFMYFSDSNYPGSPRLSKLVPFEINFAHDLRRGTVPNFSFISPNQCHNMHGISPSTAALAGLPACGYPDSGLDHGAIQLGDQWLQQTVTMIERSSVWEHGRSEIIIAWDKNDYSTDTSGGPFSPIGANGAVLGGGPAPLIVAPNRGRRSIVNDVPQDHYTTLYAIEKMWHLGCLANTCNITNGRSFMNLFTVRGPHAEDRGAEYLRPWHHH